ncbi:hypothetical protein D9M69_699050 [compost metagenome]
MLLRARFHNRYAPSEGKMTMYARDHCAAASSGSVAPAASATGARVRHAMETWTAVAAIAGSPSRLAMIV